MSRPFVALALGVEAIGLGLMIACSFFDTPFPTDKTGTAGRIQWGPNAPAPSDMVPCSCYFVEVAGTNAYIFQFTGPVKPDGPGPVRGQPIEVSYLETIRGWVILSVTTDPERTDRVTYTTPDYDRFRNGMGVATAAIAGLFIGAAVAVAGALALRRSVPGSRAGTLSTSLGLASVLGVAPVVGFTAQLPGWGLTYGLFTLAWIGAAIGAVLFAVVSRSRREQPAVFAGLGLIASIAVSTVGVVAWFLVAMRILSSVS